ncbi:four helix bundle protein [Thalassotalea mangrovi]|uniref:Four helix bundle protein n=1 Tax=Thalassotalea mangrovi TaxID=2572245 RepID=A0A4U1B6T6_9GAMM|nr:four helix bundle protein [Thalassotalea mangrovi]TKB46117.1 four helix bundle protein [Thalassotalea mangrovi]
MYHEKLKVWQHSFELSVKIYAECEHISNWGFRDQITRSALSVPSNIAEGIEKPTLNDKKKFLYIAKGSLAEFKTQVMVGERIQYLEPEVATHLKKEIEVIDFMLTRLISSLAKNYRPKG